MANHQKRKAQPRKAIVSITILVLALTLTPTLCSADWVTSIGSTISQGLIYIITLPAEAYIYFGFTPLISGLMQNPQMYCLPDGVPGYDRTCTYTAGVKLLSAKWIQIMVPFYGVAVLLTGLFIILKSGTARGRARARAMFLKLLFGMVIVALAPVIYQLMLETSKTLVYYFLMSNVPKFNFFFFSVDVPPLFSTSPIGSGVGVNSILFTLTHSGLALSCLIVYLGAVAVLISSVFVWVRNLLVFVYGVFFPLFVFLYSFEITKPMGEKYIRDSLKWVFVPAFQALVLAFTLNVSQNIKLWDYSTGGTSIGYAWISSAMAGMVVLGGLFSFAFAPFILSQFMSWVGNALQSIGLGGGYTWMVMTGGLMAGGGTGAITAADGAYARDVAAERFMSTWGGRGALTPASGGGGGPGGAPAGGSAGGMPGGGAGAAGGVAGVRGAMGLGGFGAMSGRTSATSDTQGYSSEDQGGKAITSKSNEDNPWTSMGKPPAESQDKPPDYGSGYGDGIEKDSQGGTGLDEIGSELDKNKGGGSFGQDIKQAMMGGEQPASGSGGPSISGSGGQSLSGSGMHSMSSSGAQSMAGSGVHSTRGSDKQTETQTARRMSTPESGVEAPTLGGKENEMKIASSGGGGGGTPTPSGSGGSMMGGGGKQTPASLTAEKQAARKAAAAEKKQERANAEQQSRNAGQKADQNAAAADQEEQALRDLAEKEQRILRREGQMQHDQLGEDGDKEAERDREEFSEKQKRKAKKGGGE